MKKELSERNKKIVDNVIIKIKNDEMSIGEGYDKFVSNLFGGLAFVYYIDKLEENNRCYIDDKGMLVKNSKDVWLK